MQPADFNSYGSRRGNDDVMVRGTFANIRIKNLMFGGEEGGNTLYFTDGAAPEKLSIYDAAMKYKAAGVPLVVLAGKEYGTGSSRDWAAKGTNLLGVKAVIAESFERIHRSNLVGMGVLPLQFQERRERAVAGSGRLGDLRHHRPGRRRRQARPRSPRARRRHLAAVPGRCPAADPEGSRILPPWRPAAVRAAPAGRQARGLGASGFAPGCAIDPGQWHHRHGRAHWRHATRAAHHDHALPPALRTGPGTGPRAGPARRDPGGGRCAGHAAGRRPAPRPVHLDPRSSRPPARWR